MTAIAWLIPPLAFAAGYFAWTRLPPGDGEQDDPLESAFAMLMAGVLIAALTALLLAELGALRPGPLAGLLVVWTAALWRLPGRLPPGPAPSGRSTAAALLVTAALGAVVAPGSEDMLGGRDQGVYASIAAWVAKEGTLRIHSSALAEVGSLEGGPFPLSGQFLPGYHVADARRGSINPQFFHLHPVMMAVGGLIGGLNGALLVPPLTGVLSGLAAFLFLRRMLGPGAAVAGTLLLTLNLAQVWGMRNPYSETFAQLSVFCTLWCVARGHETGGIRWGVLGAAALGAGFLNRIDAPLVLLALLPALVALQAAQPRAPHWIVAALLPGTLLLAAWGVAHALSFAPLYVWNLGPFFIAGWTATLAGLVLAAIAFRWRRGTRRAIELLHAHGHAIWIAAAVALCAAFAFALWIRPRLEPFHVFPNYPIRSFREESLIRIGWYVSMTGLWAALGGVVVLLRRWFVGRRPEWAPFLMVFLAFSVLFLALPNVHPDHPWWTRRYLPAIIPGTIVAIAAFASWLWSAGGRWRPAGRAAAALVVAIVGLHEARLTAPFWRYREQQGAARQVAELARHVPEHALLVVSRTGVGVRLATPLAFHWGRTVVPIAARGTPEDVERQRLTFEAQVRRWIAGGRDVLWLTRSDGHSMFITELVEWREVTRFELRMNTMSSGFSGPPRRVQTIVEPYRLLRAAAVRPAPCAPRGVTADSPLLGMAQGVYDPESDGAVRFRWAAPDARIVFPACERTGRGRPRAVRVRARCPRNGCSVDVAVNGHAAGALEIGPALSDFDVDVPPAALAGSFGPVEVRFTGGGFVPAEEGMGADLRLLSFQLAGVRLRSEETGAVSAPARPSDPR